MRKRNIKSVAHWVIMSILLLFPVLMVGISAFANDEQTVTVTETTQYQTNEVNSASDLIEGNVYEYRYAYLQTQVNPIDVYCYRIILPFDNGDAFYDFRDVYANGYLYFHFDFANDDSYICVDFSQYFEITFSNEDLPIYFVFDVCSDLLTLDELFQYTLDVRSSDWLGEVTTDVDIQNASYKQEVNNWANGFKNLPVNQWYGQLLNAIGVGQTENSVMNVIYVYPLYVLWVYILDIIVDCFLVIINFGHNALHRLGGDNE